MSLTARKRGRRVGSRHQDDIRAKIQAGQLIIALNNHATGKKLYKKDSQVTAAVALLKKIVPDLSSVDMHVETSPFDGLSEADMMELVAEALRDLQELKAVSDAESIIRRIAGTESVSAPGAVGRGAEEAQG